MKEVKALFRKVDTVILRVHNLGSAREWYLEKLGLGPGIYDEKERLAILKVGSETSITLYELKPGQTKPGPNTYGNFPIFYANDIEHVHKELTRKRVKAGSIQGDPGSTRWFSFHDPDGNRLEVCHY